MRVSREDTIGIIIDIQEKFSSVIFDFDKLVQNSIRLIQGLSILGTPILITEQYPKGLGKTISPIANLLGENYQPIEKMSFSAADEETFMRKLKKSGKRNILLFGIESHVCVLQTALDLLKKKYNVFIIQDCVSSRNLSDKEIALNRICSEGGFISSSESVLFELCRYAGTEEFKAISKLVK